MATAVAQYEDLRFKKFLLYSLVLHGSLAVLIIIAAFFHWDGNAWGGVGGDQGGVNVSLVSNAGLPMPKEPEVTESKVIDPTKSLYKEEPLKPPPEPKTDATKIPKFDKEKPLPPSRPSRVLENKTPPPDNAVPGHGGTPNLPTGYSQNPGTSSGVSIQYQGGGDFATRYGWYIESVKRRVQGNWNQFTIDAAVRQVGTARSSVEFTINKDGSIKNAHVVQTSGNSSMDTSGLRAILSSDPMPRLPSDYSGSYVVVTFDFDLALSH